MRERKGIGWGKAGGLWILSGSFFKVRPKFSYLSAYNLVFYCLDFPISKASPRHMPFWLKDKKGSVTLSRLKNYNTSRLSSTSFISI
jgi:hypothetical protein